MMEVLVKIVTLTAQNVPALIFETVGRVKLEKISRKICVSAHVQLGTF